MKKELRGYFAIDDLGHVHAFEGSVGDELAQRGILFQRDGVWRIKNADITAIEDRYPYLAVCDFCNARPVVWDIDCETFEDPWGNVSERGWAACEACGQCVADDNRAGLMRRVKARFKGFTTNPFIETQQRLFWTHYKGITRMPARPFGH